MSRRWIVALGVASACGGQLRARPPAAEYVDAIRLEGNHAIGTGTLEPALALHETVRERAALDPYLLDADTDRLRAAYLKRGFFEVKVTARVERRSELARVVVFTIVEGRRAVTQVEIVGLPPEVAPADARALVALRDGAPFDYEVYDAAKLPLAALVENAGYAHAVVVADVVADPATARATAHYQVLAGVRCTFGKIRFTRAVHPSLEAAVRARLRFATGERYSLQATEASQGEIYDIGRFATVQIAADKSGDGPVVDVAIELSEANRHELHGGFGFGYEPLTYEVRGRAGFGYVPASQPLITIASDARVALTAPHSGDTSQLEPKVRGLVTVQRLDLFRPRLRGEAEVGADYQTVEAYTWAGEHVRLGLGSPLGPRWLQLRVGWLLERLQFSKLDASIASDPATLKALGLVGQTLRGVYQASLVADLRDNPIEPHRGAYLDVRVAEGTPLAGGDHTYLQLTPELRGYFSIGGVVIAARARVGAFYGDVPVPVTERYYSGGTSGQRGFSERRLAPRVSACVPGSTSAAVIGGAGLIETGIELRRRLGTLWDLPVGANVFLDGGDVECTVAQLDAANLYWAVGAGIWAKVVGDLKVRIDVGYRLNRTAAPDPLATTGGLENVAVHLGVGEVY